MIKKILVGALILGGGAYFIKKILPQIRGGEKLETDFIDIDELWRQRQEQYRQLGINTKKELEKKLGGAKDASDIDSWIFAPELNYDKMSDEEKEKLRQSIFPNGTFERNNLESYQGLKGVTFNFPVVNVPKP